MTLTLNRRGFVALAGATALASPAIAQRARALRFGSPMPTSSSYHKAMEIFAEEMGKLSGGKLKIELYPNAQLGGLKDMLTSVQLGTQSMLITVPAWYSSFVKQMDVFTLPFISSSPERLRTALEGGFGKKMEGYARESGFQIVGYWLTGPRHMLNNVRPVKTAADMNGLKMRIISSQVYMAAFRALSANPAALDYSELYLALQQKTVDGMDLGLPDVISGKYYEVVKYATLTSHVIDFFAASMNKALYDGMTAEEKGMIAQAMKTATDWQWTQQMADIAAAEDKLKSQIEIIHLSPTEREEFAKLGRSVYPQFEASIGKDLIAEATKALGAA
ncbi:MAG: TRAP transporter substrate-binding protein [Rhodospirillales bacterium]